MHTDSYNKLFYNHWKLTMFRTRLVLVHSYYQVIWERINKFTLFAIQGYCVCVSEGGARVREGNGTQSIMLTRVINQSLLSYTRSLIRINRQPLTQLHTQWTRRDADHTKLRCFTLSNCFNKILMFTATRLLRNSNVIPIHGCNKQLTSGYRCYESRYRLNFESTRLAMKDNDTV